MNTTLDHNKRKLKKVEKIPRIYGDGGYDQYLRRDNFRFNISSDKVTTNEILKESLQGNVSTGDSSTSTLVSSLEDLTDTIITAPSNNDLLTYNGAEWVNESTSNVMDGDYLRLDTQNDPLTGDLNMGGKNLESVGVVELNTGYTETGSEPVGAIWWNADEETFNVKITSDVTLQAGQEIFFEVTNQTGSDLTNGKFAMFAGTLGASGKFLAQYGIADGSLPPEYTMGLFTETIANGGSGKVTWFGKVRGIDTTGTPYGEVWNDGDLIYASPTTAGALTNQVPGNGFRKILVASVVKAHSNGTIFIRPTWRPKLEELDGVEITSIQNRQAIQYDSVSGLYKNSSELPNHIDNTSNPHDTSDANLLVSDITTNNATTLAHGFLPKLSGSASQYLNGLGNYSTITGANTPVGYNETTFSSQTSVNIVHNFGVKPLVQVLDDSGSPLVEIPLSIVHNSDNDFTVNFSSAQSGSIIASAGNAFPNITTVSANYTITNNDNIIVASAVDITITLPTASGITGKTFSIDNASGGFVIVDTTGSETIWGEDSQILPNNSTIIVYSTGSNWRIT